MKAGGRDGLRAKLADPDAASRDASFTEDERLTMRYALAVTREVENEPRA